MLFFTVFSFIIGFNIGKKIIEIKRIDKNSIILQELSNFISYSELFEDLILFCIFYDVKNGFYIDIGVNDPNLYSVTKAFYLRGWNGINVEPLQKKFKALVENRKRDINLQIGLAQFTGNKTFYQLGVRSTFHKQYLKGKNVNTVNIIVDTMANISIENIIQKMS